MYLVLVSVDHRAVNVPVTRTDGMLNLRTRSHRKRQLDSLFKYNMNLQHAQPHSASRARCPVRSAGSSRPSRVPASFRTTCCSPSACSRGRASGRKGRDERTDSDDAFRLYTQSSPYALPRSRDELTAGYPLVTPGRRPAEGEDVPRRPLTQEPAIANTSRSVPWVG